MDNIIGSRINILLDRNGMCQKDLAKSAHLTEASVSRYIRGERIPNGKAVADIAKALHCTTDFLLGFDAEPNAFYDFNKAINAIDRSAKYWSSEQKTKLVIKLFEN